LKKKEEIDFDASRINVITKPTHGTLDNEYFYHPSLTYVGEDRAVFLVEVGNYRIKVAYVIRVLNTGTGNKGDWTYCPNKKLYWKISSANSEYVSDAQPIIPPDLAHKAAQGR
jgi:hypothetical protein